MAGNFNYAIADAGDIRLISNKTGQHVLYSPYANSTNIGFTSSQFYAMARGVRAIRFDNGREGTATFEFEVFNLKFIPILMGGDDWAAGVNPLFVRKEFTIGATVDLVDTPNVGTLSIWKLEADNVGDKSEITVGTPASNPDEYSIAGSTATFNTSDVGQKAVAYFMKDSAGTALTYSVPANKFPTSYTIDCVSTITRKDNGVEEPIHMRINNAKPISELTLNFSSTEVTTLTVTFDLLPDANDNLLEMTRP